MKLRDESHLSIALQPQMWYSLGNPPHQCDFHSLWWPLALATHMAPGTQQVPELTGYLLYLFPEFGFAPHIIEPGWGSWIQFQHAWVFPYQQAVLSCQQGVQGFNSILTLSTWRQSPIPQVKGSVPQDHPPTGCCLKLACYLYF